MKKLLMVALLSIFFATNLVKAECNEQIEYEQQILEAYNNLSPEEQEVFRAQTRQIILEEAIRLQEWYEKEATEEQKKEIREIEEEARKILEEFVKNSDEETEE